MKLLNKILIYFFCILYTGSYIQLTASAEDNNNSEFSKPADSSGIAIDSSRVRNDSLNASKLILHSTDSLDIEKDTSNIKPDSLKIKVDTVRINNPLNLHGATYLVIPAKLFIINKKDFQFNNYNGIFEIIKDKGVFYPLSLGYSGAYNSFSAYGSSGGALGLTYNSRPLIEPEYGNFPLEMINSEFLENVEILTGSDAAILSDNSTGTSINIQEIRYNTKIPYTRVWYYDGVYRYLGADGVFSQNIMPNTNFTFGFHRQGNDGRFANSWLDYWSVRGILRWNPSDLTSISLSENFTNSGVGLNGGVDIAAANANGASIYDELAASVNYSSLNDRIVRHDLTLTLSSILANDSSSAFSCSVYFTNSDRSMDIPSSIIIDTTIPSGIKDYTSKYYGVTGKYEQSFYKVLYLTLGGDFYYFNTPASLFNIAYNGSSASGFIRGQIDFTRKFSISGGARIRSAFDKIALSFGGAAGYQLIDSLSIKADLSYFDRYPTPTEGLNLSLEKHILGLLELSYKSGDSYISSTIFIRNISEPIISYGVTDETGVVKSTVSINSDSRRIFGGTMKFGLKFWDRIGIFTWASGYKNDFLVFSGFTQIHKSYTNDSENYRYPLWYLGGKLEYHLEIGESIMNIGFSASAHDKKNGDYFVPFTRTYITSEINSGISFDGINAFIILRLGNAFAKLEYRNILSRGFYFTPVYPELDRGLLLSVAWSIFD
ncbi:MAG: hypothetical protein QG635_236 [Bacteroidota bacterium]|nr:hypothetical protein [Bacteroidota bacterium]